MSWHWQDDACWQSCSAAAQVRASGWVAERAAQYQQLQQLAARQPLTGIDPVGLRQCMLHASALSQVAQTLVVIGTGGASLGAQAMCTLAGYPGRVRFLENCDPATLDVFLRFNREQTAWCIISKSGETVETLATALALMEHYNDADLLRERVRVITTDQDSTLRRLARAQGWAVIDHPPALGGRYSMFSSVGLLPAAFAGLPIGDIARHAHEMLQQLLQQNDMQLLQHAAWFAANLPEKPMHLLMGYADRLRAATQWYKQLWAESLGKDGKGATPVTAIGSIDQHSQLQLYLDGPRDKLVTLWLPDSRGKGPVITTHALPGAEFLQHKTMGDVMHATAEATVTTLRQAGVPMRVLRGELTAPHLAAWMARQMLETLLVAQLLGVDPYSQPAVEAGKKLTRAALAGEGL